MSDCRGFPHERLHQDGNMASKIITIPRRIPIVKRLRDSIYSSSHSNEVHRIFSLLPLAFCLLPIPCSLFPVPHLPTLPTLPTPPTLPKNVLVE
ncbi:hypothetical protein [Moorena producens]|uniref:hypothetical protein n=1 Tax=Moorena producens TaxID=1155739 RepID=UPI003C7203B1